ncbi:MAG: TolC family protein [Draconibacterium sp.]
MKLTFKLVLLLAAFFIVSFKVNAQEGKVTFSLDEALQYATQHSYVLQNSKKDITIAEKKVWETISIGLPQVSGSANYNAFLNLPVTLLPGEFFGGEPGTYVPVKFGQDFSSDFGLSVNQLIFDGSYIIGVGSVQLYVNLSKQRYEKTAIDIREAVTQAYYLVLIGERYKAVMEDNLRNVEKTYRETKIMYENGFREEQDVEQIQLVLRNAESEVSKADREVKISKTVLKYTMGYNIETDIQLTDEIEKFLQPLEAKQNSSQFDFSNHIDYRLAASNFEVSEKLLGIEKVEYLPKLNGFYSYSKNAYGNDANLFNSKTSWYPSSLVGLQMTLSIFNSGQKRSKVQQAKIEVEKAENDVLLTEQTLQKDYLTAVAQMESALETFDNDKENRELAERIRTKTKIKFDNGMSTSTELTQIENQYIDAYRALVNSTLQLLQADLKLKKATGSL